MKSTPQDKYEWLDEVVNTFETDTRAYSLDGGTNATERLANRTQAKQAILNHIEEELIKAQQVRITRNKSFCGCPFCEHHSKPYETHIGMDNPNYKKESIK